MKCQAQHPAWPQNVHMKCSLEQGHLGRHEVYLLSAAWPNVQPPIGKVTSNRICGDPCPVLNLTCTLPGGHIGCHESWVTFPPPHNGTTRIASWPNVPGPTAVPVAPQAPAQPADPNPAPTGTTPSGPDPDDTCAPDPRPKPIDYSDWLDEEDLL